MICPTSKRQRQDLIPGMREPKLQTLHKAQNKAPAGLIPGPSSLLTAKSLAIPVEMRKVYEPGGVLEQRVCDQLSQRRIYRYFW